MYVLASNIYLRKRLITHITVICHKGGKTDGGDYCAYTLHPEDVHRYLVHGFGSSTSDGRDRWLQYASDGVIHHTAGNLFGEGATSLFGTPYLMFYERLEYEVKPHDL